jgi:hypothetical protein
MPGKTPCSLMRCTISRTVVRGSSCLQRACPEPTDDHIQLGFFQVTSLAGRMTASCTCSRLRWLAGEKKRMVSAKSPNNSMRRGFVIQGRKDVDDAAADAKIARFFHDHAAGVPAGHQFGHQAIRFDLLFGDDQLRKVG